MSFEYHGNVRQLIKRLDRLKAEKGEEIFIKKQKRTKGSKISFDYDRFREEIDLWHKYIDPICKKYNYNSDIYRHQQQIPYNHDLHKVVAEKIRRHFKFNLLDITEMSKAILYLLNYDVPDLEELLVDMHEIGRMRIGPGRSSGIRKDFKIKDHKTPLKVFWENLKIYIRQGFLYHLLLNVKKFDNYYAFSLKEAQKEGVKETDSHGETQLEPFKHKDIFSTTPYQNAVDKFKHKYTSYHYEKNDHDKKKTITDLNISESTFKRNMGQF